MLQEQLKDSKGVIHHYNLRKEPKLRGGSKGRPARGATRAGRRDKGDRPKWQEIQIGSIRRGRFRMSVEGGVV